MLRINRAFGLENPRNYPAAIVEELVFQHILTLSERISALSRNS